MSLDLREIAAQLRCPHGELGGVFAQTMNLRNLAQIAAALRLLDLRPHERVLELGFGNGGLLGYVLAQAQGLHYTGVEVSADMHAAALAFNQPFVAAGLADYVCYDGLRIPAADGVFDALFSVNTVYFWQDPAGLLADCARVLKPGGRLLLTFCERDFMQALPFSAFGFSLYDAADVRALAAALPLRVQGESRSRDWAVSKDNALLERESVHLCFVKECS